MEYKISLCKESDTLRLKEFYDNVIRHLDATVNYPLWKLDFHPCLEEITQYVKEGCQYICEDGGRIIGAFVLNEDPEGNYSVGDWTKPLCSGEFLVIHSLAVDGALSGKGIGSYMVRYCIDKATISGYKAIRLDAVPTNIPAIKLYTRMGFTYAGEKDLERGIPHIPTFTLLELNL